MNIDDKETPPKTTISFLKWILLRIMHQKKYWLFPFWLFLVALAIVLFVSGNSMILPAIYIAF